jgi:hypothetical protein
MLQQAHTLYVLCLHFLRKARFLENIEIWNRGARTKHREASSVATYETSRLSHFCDAFGGERGNLKLRGKSDVLSDRWHRRFSRWAPINF